MRWAISLFHSKITHFFSFSKNTLSAFHLPLSSKIQEPPVQPKTWIVSTSGHPLCIFCGTFLKVTLTGISPAPCPAEFGLSSGMPRGRPTCSRYYSIRFLRLFR